MAGAVVLSRLNAVPKLQVVLTKCDMVTREDLARRFLLMKQQLDEVLPRESRLPVMMVSASKGQGVAELRRDLAALIPAPLIQDLEHRNEALRAAGGRAPSPPSASAPPTRPSSPSAPFKRPMADKPSVARSIIRKGQSPPPARTSGSSPPRRSSGPPFSPPRRGPSDKPPGAGRWEQQQSRRGRSSSPPRHRPSSSSSSKPGGAGRPDRRAASPKKTRK